jgi:hypothetical protein
MTRWVIAALVTVLLSVASLGGLFWLSVSMAAQQRQWMDQGVRLSSAERTAVEVAHLWAVYWYMLGPLLVGILTALVFSVAAHTRRRESGASERESA